VALDQRFWAAEWPPTHNRTATTAYLEDLGGPAAVASVTVAALGGTAIFAGARGDDAAGERVEAFLRSRGVDTRYLTIFPGAKTPVAGVVIVLGGERFLFPYPGAGLRDEPDWVRTEALDGADAVLVDSRFPVAGAALARAATARGIPVVMDFDSVTPAAWALATAATHVIADEELAAQCGGVAVLLERLRAGGAWGAVTLGAAGVVHAGGRVPAFRVPVRDSTGAGDVFHGAFALAVAEGRDTHDALVLAAAAAAIRCQTGFVPGRGAVEALMVRGEFETDRPEAPRHPRGDS